MPEPDVIRIKGARVHNLKNVDVDIPRNKLVVITGISGSGKSSLAFDTLYADGQRRYVESLSAYARQFLGAMEKPDVDTIEGISPAIAIDQKSVLRNPRSTVGTITEIYDYLRLLFARVGTPHCPECGRGVSAQTPTQIVRQILALPKKTEISLLAPIVRERKGEYRSLLEEIGRAGFRRLRLDSETLPLEEALERKLERYKAHSIEVVIDRLTVGGSKDDKLRISSSVETALKMGKGILIVNKSKAQSTKSKNDTEDLLFSEALACEHCGINLPPIEPRTFSFNSPHGACPVCTGIGYKLEVDSKLVIPNPRLSIAEGAIKAWMSASHRVGRQSWYWWMLEELAQKLGFDVNTPWEKLSAKVQKVVLYGEEQDTGERIQGTDGTDGRFEGVIPNLMRRWKETDSDWTRGEIEKYMRIRICEACQGKRLRPEALAVKIHGHTIDEVTALSIEALDAFFRTFLFGKEKLSANEAKIAKPIVKEVLNRLKFLLEVGLPYLALDRSSTTLAGGEAQRIRLATQIGTRLTGVLYILDEPSIGLHARDQERLIETLKELRDLGNTVVVVEHDPQTIRAADWVIDVGPGAGKHGGRITFSGTPKELFRSKTLTGEYLSGKRKIAVLPTGKQKEKGETKYLVVKGAREHNLKHIDVSIPLGKFVCVSGVSGSGKSSLVNDILGRALIRYFWKAKDEPGAHASLEGLEYLNKAIIVDQSPIGRTPRSNPATYTGAFTPIRDLFASTKEAKVRGYGAGRFSFNVKGGRCETCQGEGMQKIEMQFLPDVWVECEECNGTRYTKEALEIEWHGKNIAEVLTMTIEEAAAFFSSISSVSTKLQTLTDVGLGYMQLGQPATTLSGGEAQRVKLATELARKATGKTLYILDEPTTGLHFSDIEKLLKLLRGLVEKGNTVLVIEHNLDVIANADWVIDLGPEGGEGGGHIIASGRPLDLIKNSKSYTGQFLRKR
ncbi:MAG: excinuclease ABC subunit A [Candidatus Terrybacteria bacterium RIFCSPHIGHO2_01_FULL_48_17]|uniref:UvrABC system protein A n=1 Tax=Candidatus Terrybacteria bacterium RIFCSPHIGHO2_01_FULL_48_17 TaxID=1802362 RepID=A0A1G2PHN9_9BACT|nr:MAG: excinuclease ABC subunit A [Candidatus Terrybacteria bacterium RIFCSPHIGHO2_01_FULL_48_17]OHA53569.1 MAG: excinuclease ABC subunit A [Candidatus Terrybacteria bacterium RIFCSPLOWO2_01_FULL_48_14]